MYRLSFFYNVVIRMSNDIYLDEEMQQQRFYKTLIVPETFSKKRALELMNGLIDMDRIEFEDKRFRDIQIITPEATEKNITQIHEYTEKDSRKMEEKRRRNMKNEYNT